jgi:hypothetical protein
MAHVIAILCRLKHMIPEQTLLLIYNSLIAPHLSYGIEAWGNAPSCVLKRIQTLQKKALRVISKSNYNCHTNPICKKYNILKIPELFQLHCVKLFYRTKLCILPEYHIHRLTLMSTHGRQTRQIHDIYIDRITFNIQKQGLNFKIGHSWNNLPNSLKSISNISLHTFSKKVKCHLLTLYDVNCEKENCFSCQQATISQT